MTLANIVASAPGENQLAETLLLNDEWQIEIDGRQGAIQVPGVWEVQGFPRSVQSAVYRRQVTVPASWTDARVMLCFGAVSYAVSVSVNGIEIGGNSGLWHPFELDVTAALHFGADNEITLSITKPGTGTYHYRDVLVGFIPYVGTTFGGPWQAVWLAAHRAPAFRNLRIVADASAGEVRCSVEIDSPAGSLLAEVIDASGKAVARTELVLLDNCADFALKVAQPASWSPDAPIGYTLRLTLSIDGRLVSEARRTFGFRRLQAEGDRLYLNQEAIFIRGILSWGWNPETLAPTLTDDQIRGEFRRIREMGFNLIKLCLFVPPPRFFEIADEEGMLLWLELPMWWQRLSSAFRMQTGAEYERIFSRVHHHPSIVIYSLGCELGADMADAALLDTLNQQARHFLNGALVCDNSGSGEAYKGLDFDFADFNDYHFYCDLHYFAPLLDHFRRDWRPARPWLFGEFCDADDYRDPERLTEDSTYSWWRDLLGVEGNLNRWAYSVQEQRMKALNLPFTAQQLVEISRQQSFVVRKAILERVRTRRDIGGYVLTGLRDTPISTSGVFDDLGQPKYDAGAFRQFNADAVLTLEVARARTWTYGGDRPAPIDPFNHAAGALVNQRVIYAGPGRKGGQLRWSVNDAQNAILQQGQIEISEPITGESPQQIAAIAWQAPEPAGQVAVLTLKVALGDLTNEWPMWIYPKRKPLSANVTIYDPVGQLVGLESLAEHEFTAKHETPHILITSVFNTDVQRFLREGGQIIYLASGGPYTDPVPFWRESIKLVYERPLTRHLTRDLSIGMQFYNLATDHALNMERFQDAQVSPIIRRLDARLFSVLDYLAEVRLGSGTMLASTFNFCCGAGDQTRGLDANIAGRYLLELLIDYLFAGITDENERLSN